METEVTITRYNVAALLGWVGLIIGLVGGVLQYFYPSSPGVWFLTVGMIGGGITITLAGPLKTRSSRRVQLRPVSLNNDDATKE